MSAHYHDSGNPYEPPPLDTGSEKKKEPLLEKSGWIALALGAVSFFVALIPFFSPTLPNIGMPFVVIFFLVSFTWLLGIDGIKKTTIDERVAGIVGIVFSIPAALVFFLYVFYVVIPLFLGQSS